MRWTNNAGMIFTVMLVFYMSIAFNFGYGQTCIDSYKEMTRLYQAGKLSEAISIGENALLACEKELGKESDNFAGFIKSLADCYQTFGNFSKAETYYNESLSILKNNNKLDSPYALGLLNNFANLYNSGKYQKAEHLYLMALSNLEKNEKLKTQDHVSILKNLGVLYLNQGYFSKAEPFFKEAISLQEEISDTSQPEYALLLTNLGELYTSSGNYIKAENILFRALSIQQKTLGTENLDYTKTLSSLGLCYRYQDKYEESKRVYSKSLLIRKKILGIEHPLYASNLLQLGNLYFDEGLYKKAELCYMNALNIQQKCLGIKSVDYAATLNSIANLFSSEGKFDKAEAFFYESLSIRQEILGLNHPNYAASLEDLANFYTKIGNYQKAELFIDESIAIQKNVLGTTHTNYAAAINDLAQIYVLKGMYLKAKPLLIEATSIYEKANGVKSRNYLTSETNLAVLYSKLGNYLKAETNFLKVLAIQKELFGQSHLDYGIILSHLANNYLNQKSYNKAENCYLQALVINSKLFNKQNGYYTTSLDLLTNFYNAIGSSNYIGYLNELLPLYQKQIIQQTNFQSRSELSAYLKANQSNFIDSKFSIVYPFKVKTDTTYCELFNTAILLKNLTLRNTTQVQNKIKESKNSTLINTLEEFHVVKRQLNKYASLPKAEQPKDIRDLENSADSLEKRLVRGSKEFKAAQDFTNTTWKKVQKSLKNDEAAIEFVSFQYLSGKWTDSTLYAAMIIRPDYTFPKIIPLFEQKQLDNLVKRRSSLPEESYLNNLYGKDNFGLYNLIVKPIDSLLKGVTTIYTAPSGSLYNLNLAEIISHKPDGGSFTVHILGTTGELPRYSELQINKTTMSNAVVFGGVNYDTASNSGISFQPLVYTPGFEQVASETNRGGVNHWSYLPGTLTEARQVAKINSDAGLKVTLLKGDEANESAFKNLNGFSNPFILHLATHGYFFPNPAQEKPQDFNWQGNEKKLVYKWSEDPLLRSGLILAGANKAWGNSAFITDSTEDGILTSMEVANVDLSNCKLAVLSACETGLGDINGSEGVFGLQRGFKLAGVKNIIMSLWKIPDVQSAELLKLFYENCFKGLSVHESLKQAQKRMSEKYPPYYWAGFVLLE